MQSQDTFTQEFVILDKLIADLKSRISSLQNKTKSGKANNSDSTEVDRDLSDEKTDSADISDFSEDSSESEESKSILLKLKKKIEEIISNFNKSKKNKDSEIETDTENKQDPDATDVNSKAVDDLKKKKSTIIKAAVGVAFVVLLFGEEFFSTPEDQKSKDGAVKTDKKSKGNKEEKSKNEKASSPEAPVAEAPVAETPVAEAPVAETPVAEAPVAETPVAEAPVAETPVAEAPVAETPVAEAPVAETPVAEAPVAETPVAEAPVAETPDSENLDISNILNENGVEGNSNASGSDANLGLGDSSSKDTLGDESSGIDLTSPDLMGNGLEDNSKNQTETDFNEKVLKDLENQVKESTPVVEQKEYIAPPDYEYVGRGLVYNCSGKHWACIDGASFKVCELNFSSVKYLKKTIECYPESVFETQQGCEISQNRKIISNTKTDFCSGGN